jgi:hypothetical protein
MANVRSLSPNRTGIARRNQRDVFLSTFVLVKGTIVWNQDSRHQRVLGMHTRIERLTRTVSAPSTKAEDWESGYSTMS